MRSFSLGFLSNSCSFEKFCVKGEPLWQCTCDAEHTLELMLHISLFAASLSTSCHPHHSFAKPSKRHSTSCGTGLGPRLDSPFFGVFFLSGTHSYSPIHYRVANKCHQLCTSYRVSSCAMLLVALQRVLSLPVANSSFQPSSTSWNPLLTSLSRKPFLCALSCHLCRIFVL